MSNPEYLIPGEDQERQKRAFLGAIDGLPRVLAQRKRYSGVAVQFRPENAAQLVAGGLHLEEHADPNNGADYTYDRPATWALFGVPIATGDYIVNVSGGGIRVFTRAEFEESWQVVGDA